ncbi:MerR family transcriptional regulator [Streptomyces litchfieldiae]|uniref:MerR family transcriptional regulator n=1 Tax=Streptomyces litchfieldiae TaxID=3075543 RepID=UPI00374E184F
MTIGEVSALFGLAPSTLRWWERQGLISPRRTEGSRRVYGRDELRRIAFVYICRTMAMMPLDAIADVLADGAASGHWQDTVRARVSALDQQIERITAARGYLTHMLRCTHQDPTRCPHLDREIHRHTPWRTGRDESPPPGRPRNETAQGVCPACGHPVPRSATGRPRTYCSNACRQRAHRRRRLSPPQAPQAPSEGDARRSRREASGSPGRGCRGGTPACG